MKILTKISLLTAVSFTIAMIGLPTAHATDPITLWVNPTTGNDSNSGTTLGSPLNTIHEAWNRIPANSSIPYVVNLAAGSYNQESIPNYWENKTTTTTFQPTTPAQNLNVHVRANINMYQVHNVTFDSLDLVNHGDVFHCELCTHITIKNSNLDGENAAQETIKINQSNHILLQNNVIKNAWDNAIDFVAVNDSVITRNDISGAGDWCAYTKGGSNNITVTSNVIHNCGTGGYTAGQGTGLEFMVAPYYTYEATNVLFENNFIHDTEGAAFGANGGYNITFNNNNATQVGSRSHLVEVTYGYRSCDGNTTQCQNYLNQGAWGTSQIGGDSTNIPDKNITITNNTIVNTAPFASQWQHFEISTPRTNINNATNRGPSPATTDEGLVLRGNRIRNGTAAMELGINTDSVCTNANPTCTLTKIIADNDINGTTPITPPTGLPIPSSDPTPPPTPTNTIPSPVRNLQVTPRAGTLTLQWTAPATGYPATYSYRGQTNTGQYCVTTATSCVIRNLTNGVSYRVGVTATNTTGTSTPTYINNCIPYTVPSQVRNLRIINYPNNRTVRIAWAPPITNNGRPVLSYRVRISKPNSTTLFEPWVTVNARTFAIILPTSTVRNKTYRIQIFTVNAAGNSAITTLNFRR